MVQSNLEYQGELHCKLTHGPSGIKIATDAPKDNMGRGESFSPTDLVGAALVSCIVTTMAIVARRNNLELVGVTASVKKEMVADPLRRIARLPVQVTVPMKVDDEMRKRLENAGNTCPVKKSLAANLDAPIEFKWG